MVVKSLLLLVSLCCVAILPELPSLPNLLLFGFGGGLVFGLLLWCLSHLLTETVASTLKPVAANIAVFVFGFAYASLYAANTLSNHLPANLLGVETEVVATVIDLPDRNSRRLRFIAQLESIRAFEGDQPRTVSSPVRGRVRLSWYGAGAPDLKAGDKVQLVVKLKAPSGFMNPGGFDLERWLVKQKIIATGYVREKSFDVSQSIIAKSFTPVSSARNSLQHKLIAASDGLSSQGLILALAVGDRSGISREHWDRFISTGTNHLLAISGLHISLVAGFFVLLVQSLWRYTGLSAKSTRRGCSLGIALVAALCYAAMAGFSVPTVRALMMFSVLVCLLLTRRHQRRTQSLAIAMIVVCLSNPLSVLDTGFWMSFTAVAVLYLVFSNSEHKSIPGIIGRLLRGHLLISVGLYPLTVLFFGQASLVAPIANLVVTPLVGMLVTPLVFLSAMLVWVSSPLATMLLTLADLLLQLTTLLLEFFSSMPYALMKLSGVSPIAVLLSVVTAILVIVPVPLLLRAISLLLVLPLFLPQDDKLAQGAYEVIFLDVGQGASSVVKTRNHTLIFDTGDQFSEKFSAADAVLIPYLRSRALTTVDLLIVSHADRDHSGGADEVLDDLDVQRLMLSSPLPQRPDASHVVCKAGDSWIWDDVTFTVLHPQQQAFGSENDRSCVLLISSPAGIRTLLPGDIEKYSEAQLLRNKKLHPVEILLSPHHGSATSSSSGFLKALQPRYVVHSAGYKNRWQFPKKEVVERYGAAGARQFSTAESGAIEFLVDDSGVQFSEYRVRHKRWWHRQ